MLYYVCKNEEKKDGTTCQLGMILYDTSNDSLVSAASSQDKKEWLKFEYSKAIEVVSFSKNNGYKMIPV